MHTQKLLSCMHSFFLSLTLFLFLIHNVFFLLLFFKTCSFSTPLMKSSLHFCTHKTSQTFFFLSPPVVLFLSKFVFFILFEKQQKKKFKKTNNIRNSKLHLRICNKTCGKRKHTLWNIQAAVA